MKLCRVVGFATSSIKAKGLANHKLLVLKDIDDTGNATGEAFLAVDTIGAGLSEVVAVTTGVPACHVLSDPQAPVDAAVIAILDSVSINKKEIHNQLKEA
ncbi:MAG: EutN/CcmL family microcompartment protein [Desulfobacteraceae bacterium]|nr:EutN/CcmL family microcompartment protein [Desulfobacteraceae bacterium]